MRTIAFYLPQFHQIPENDEWWGAGFTEWTNVRRAQPQFAGHVQPRRPAASVGEYDLTDPGVYRSQSTMAREHGVDAFCMYFYWFDGRRLLEKPVDAWRQDPSLLPYCLSWANESWTRRWDGKERHVLMPQRYDSGFEHELFKDLLPHFQAPHYVCQDGKPVLLVHRVDLIPDAPGFAARLRSYAAETGLPGLHLVAAETKRGIRPADFGFDGIAEFPPVGANTLQSAHLRPLRGVRATFRGRLMSYDRIARAFMRRDEPGFVRYRGVMPGWDNTARRQSEATIYVGSSPQRYRAWLQAARSAEASRRGDRGIVFINAWNEWAEGAYLEPDEMNGVAYLDATAGGDLSASRSGHLVTHGSHWSYSQIRSVGLAFVGSALSALRRLRRLAHGNW